MLPYFPNEGFYDLLMQKVSSYPSYSEMRDPMTCYCMNERSIQLCYVRGYVFNM